MNRFNGDGRKNLLPPSTTISGTRPMIVTRGTARRLIAMFDESGFSTHSGRGATLWVIIEHCELNKIPYNLRGSAGVGFSVTRAKLVD